jgi:thiol:disulfide interchange protein DsbD
MQFGNPYFLVGLTVVMTLVALNLFGVFEITPSAKVMDAAGTLSAKSGAAGAFFNGVLATVLATPCTAPFLGIALGFAFAASPLTILLVFTVVAAGLAFPYVLLSWNPAWLRFLPKPGLWMEQFKMLMGFPMLATAVWLVSLSSVFYSDRWFWLSVFLILLAMAAFVFGQFVQRRASGKTAGIIASLVLLGLGYVVCLEGQMDWRSPKADETVGVRTAKNGIPWEKWSAEAVAAARAQGRPVLVDFTADWCLTCQANKKIALEIPEVREKLRAINAVALLGDYTRLPKEITLELNRFNRAGVPLVLVYPRDQTRPPLVLPEALTPGIVLDALEQAAR